jgi:hypothetical protein
MTSNQKSVINQLDKLIDVGREFGLSIKIIMRVDSIYQEQLTRAKLAVEQALKETNHINWNNITY